MNDQSPLDEEDPQSKEIMSAIAANVAAGKCILFLGAAVHSPPSDGSQYTYPESDRPWSAGRLCSHLAAKTGFSERFPAEGLGDLKRVAQDYETKYQRGALIQEIKNAVHSHRRPSPILSLLAELDFPLIITTNYDQLFEDALRAAGKRPYVSIYKKNEDGDVITDDYPFDEDPKPQQPFVFKIHGDIIQGPESIVITDEDYIQFVLRMSDKQEFHPVPETIRFHFKKWPTLFIGYSLKDYNLRLLFKTLRWKIDRAGFPLAYSVDMYPDPLVFDVWFQQRRYVNFLVQDVWEFVPKLRDQVQNIKTKTLNGRP